MGTGNDRVLVEIASGLVPLAADGCAIYLQERDAAQSVVAVAAAHVDPAVERTLLHGDPRESAPSGVVTRCAVESEGRAVGEIVVWASRPLRPLAELLLCRAGAHVGAVIEARQQRRRAEMAEGARAAIISMVGHELRSPLQAMTVGVELLQLRAHDTADEIPRAWLEKRCEQLRRSVTRLTVVANRLLDVSRLEHDDRLFPSAGDDGRSLAGEELDLVAIVEHVIAELRSDAAWAGSEICVRHEGPLRGRWYRPHLETVLENLLTNALKYGADRPVDVVLSGGAHDIVIVVRDRGCGIAPEERARLFERFYRGSARAHQSGLGVGLWIVKRLVEAHGGTITCESEQGVGTTFSVRLPRDVTAIVQGPEPSP